MVDRDWLVDLRRPPPLLELIIIHLVNTVTCILFRINLFV